MELWRHDTGLDKVLSEGRMHAIIPGEGQPLTDMTAAMTYGRRKSCIKPLRICIRPGLERLHPLPELCGPFFEESIEQLSDQKADRKQ